MANNLRSWILFGFMLNSLVASVEYASNYRQDGQYFQPIRVAMYEWSEDNVYISNTTALNLFRNLTLELQEWIRGFVSVYPVTGTLRLPWNYSHHCADLFGFGDSIHSNKCKRRYWSDRVENCGYENFEIPDDHMDEFLLWSDPTTSSVDEAAGSGLNNTDLIIYMSLNNIAHCREHAQVLGFAKVCKRDHFGRPIASFLNMCPAKFYKSDSSSIKLTMRHEMLHAIGFLTDSFKWFADCSVSTLSGLYSCTSLTIGSSVWNPFQSITRGDKYIYKYVSPKFETLTNRYFNCTDSMGILWQTFNQNSRKAGQHWDQNFLQLSIMSPLITKPYFHLMDPFTVEFFEDTGWYHTNDSYVDPDYTWGRNGGCFFGREDTCDPIYNGTIPSPYFCSKHEPRGCHYLKLHKGTCQRDAPHECYYYANQPGDECFEENESSVSEEFETKCPDCRCFTTTLDPSSESVAKRGVCLERRCDIQRGMEVNINGTWLACPPGQSIQVPSMTGELDCPPSGILCTQRDMKLSVEFKQSQPLTTTVPLSTQTGSRGSTKSINANPIISRSMHSELCLCLLIFVPLLLLSSFS